MDHRRKQVVMGLSTLPALVVLFVAWRALPALADAIALPHDDAAERIAFVARWSLLPGLMLLAGVVGAARRGFHVDAIDGTRTPQSHGLEINLRYNQNTVEQLLLGLIAWIGLGLALPRDRLVVVAMATLLFTVGRIAFWIGYRLHPLARGFGMVLTIAPTIAAYAWLLRRLIGA